MPNNTLPAQLLSRLVQPIIMLQIDILKVDKSLSRPKLLFLDETRKELYVFNKWNRNVIRYKM